MPKRITPSRLRVFLPARRQTLLLCKCVRPHTLYLYPSGRRALRRGSRQAPRRSHRTKASTNTRGHYARRRRSGGASHRRRCRGRLRGPRRRAPRLRGPRRLRTDHRRPLCPPHRAPAPLQLRESVRTGTKGRRRTIGRRSTSARGGRREVQRRRNANRGKRESSRSASGRCRRPVRSAGSVRRRPPRKRRTRQRAPRRPPPKPPPAPAPPPHRHR